jgi:hypothetical protein
MLWVRGEVRLQSRDLKGRPVVTLTLTLWVRGEVWLQSRRLAGLPLVVQTAHEQSQSQFTAANFRVKPPPSTTDVGGDVPV